QCFTRITVHQTRDTKIQSQCTLRFFFFQAEDGIRDRNVTGVQTCALSLARRLPGQDKAQVATSRRRRDRGEAPSMADERASLRALLLYFLRLGTLGFGGPIALAGHMQQDLVEQRGWINAQEYKEGLAFAQLAPGPL